ncbi:cell division protein FtsQ/DivIB [Sphingomonas sp. ID0503]|uniref:cell division protein FtsQ/DivIB n=1 Tax=Sphingomonas sp. ID0503 TaxID=3399691 RepID=UPI003AFA046E
MTERPRLRRGEPARSRPPSATRRAPVKPTPRRAAPASSNSLGLPMAQIKRAAKCAGYALAVAGPIALLFFLGLPQMAWTGSTRWLGQKIGDAGFEVTRVDVRGLAHMDKMPVYEVAFDQNSMAMPLVDLQEIRGKLLRYPWIEDARVSRRLPDTLVVDVVERRPVAVWQYRQQLRLIDRSGIVLGPVDLSNMPDLPLIIGPNANVQAASLSALTEAAPQLKAMLAGANWVGGRRWDLRFHSGETLALPEGDEEARAALVKFARMDANKRLLGQGFIRFDMRIPGRMVVRVSNEPGKQVGAPATAGPGTT